MHVQCFEDMKCYSNYGKSNQGKEYRLSNGERSTFVQCNSGFITNEMLCTSSSENNPLLPVWWEFSHFAVVLQWKSMKKKFWLYHSITLKKKNVAFSAFTFVMYIMLTEF